MIDKRAILDERARRLAAVAGEAATPPAEELEVATFTLAGEEYAIETRYVREIIPLGDFTPVPGGPNFLFGVVNLRGEILAVFDLRPLLGLAGERISDLFRIIVLGNPRAEFGVLVDAVHEVTKLPLAVVLDIPGTDEHHRYVRGVTKDALVLLDGGLLINEPRFALDKR